MQHIKQIEKQQKNELAKIIDFVGGQHMLAKQLDVSQQVVSAWVKRGRISATYATIVERKTKGYFKRDHMRPDIINWNEEV